MSSLPAVLIVLRGNSASGKSTLAHRIQRTLPRGRVAVIGQDHVRREMLWSWDRPDNDAIGLIGHITRYCLELGRVTVVEGILVRERYETMLTGLLDEQRAHGRSSLIYYLDIPLPETLRRHAGKPLADHVSEEQVFSWYAPHDVLGCPGEQVFDESWSEDAILERILGDLQAIDGTTGY